VKKIIVWLLAAFLLQFGVYEYLDRVTFAPVVGFSQETIGDGRVADASIAYSYDKAYYSVLSDRDLKVYAAKGKRLIRDIPLRENETVSYLSWLQDRDILLVGTATDYASSTTVALLSIDPETGATPVTPEIRGMAEGARIESVAWSTKTNVTNILVRDRYGTWVWRTDANNWLRRLNLDDWDINRIACLRYQDVLLYDDTVLGRVYAYFYGGRIREVPLGTTRRYALIGTDRNDNVYLGALNSDNLVTSICEGKVTGNFTEIKSFASPVQVNAVTVDGNGNITVATGWVPPYGQKHLAAPVTPPPARPKSLPETETSRSLPGKTPVRPVKTARG